jgi:hypothetical protein
MAPKLDYGMICGVGIWPLKKPFSDLFGITCANYAFVADHMEFLRRFHSVERELY